MEKAIIGAVLKKRIKEKGYKQEKFAEEMGIKYSTLKKYLSGKTSYSYELLLEFAEKLDCSTEYLLALSKSPYPEHHEIAEQTRLSEDAINKICKYAKIYDTDFEGRSIIRTLDMLICEDGAISSIRDYLISYRMMDNMLGVLLTTLQNAINNSNNDMTIIADRQLSIESQKMIYVIMKLKDLKHKLTPELLADIKELDTEEDFQKALEQLKSIIHAQ